MKYFKLFFDEYCNENNINDINSNFFQKILINYKPLRNVDYYNIKYENYIVNSLEYSKINSI